MDAGTTGISRPPTVEQFVPAVRTSPLQVGIFDLEERRLTEMSKSTARLFRNHRSLDQYLDDPTSVARAIDLVRDGVVGGYQAQRSYRLADGTLHDADVWLQVLDATVPHRWALFIAAFADQPSPEAQAACPHPSSFGPMMSGTVDKECRVELVSTDLRRIWGAEAGSVVGRRVLDFVHPADRGRVELAAEIGRRDGAAVCTHARLSPDGRDWKESHILIAHIGSKENDRFAFVATADPRPLSGADSVRLADLEHRLWRIAQEIQATGVAVRVDDDLETDPMLPGLAELSTRQLEVLHRIARGERVAQIATAMYLSPSTVRNHLVAIFRKFGVHSQTELIETLRRKRAT